MNSSYTRTAATPVLRVDHVGRTYPDGAVTALVDVSLEFAAANTWPSWAPAAAANRRC